MKELRRLMLLGLAGVTLLVGLSVFADVKDPATIKTDATADLATNTEMFLQPTIDVIDSINIKFANVTAIKAGGANLPNITIVSLENHTATGDDGGGFFWLDTSGALGASAEDNGMIIESAGGANWYWRRMLMGGSMTPQMFGAIADDAVDDSTEIQAYVDAFATDLTGSPPEERKSNTIFLPRGDFIINTPIRLPIYRTFNSGKVEVVGDGTTLIVNSGPGPLFRPVDDFGTHTPAGSSATVLTDSTKSFTTNEYVGDWIFNVTDKSYGEITANAATTITVTALTLGTDNDWDQNDVYHVGKPSSKFLFRDIMFRDETSTYPTTGTAQTFEWMFYRFAIQNCSFTNFGRVIGSYDMTDTDEYLQSVSIRNNLFDSCAEIVRTSKVWEFEFKGNECDSCGEPIYILDTAAAAFINGQIVDNTFQAAGSSNEAVIRIHGPLALVIARNYFEGTNGTADALISIGTTDIDTRVGQQPRGVTIGPGNYFSPTAAQNNDPNWYPIAVNGNGDNVTVFGNLSQGRLLHVAGGGFPTTSTASNWNFYGNHSLYEQPNGEQNYLGPGVMIVRRLGYEETSGTTTEELLFDGSSVYSAAFANTGASYSVNAWVTAVQNTRNDQAKFGVAALFEHDSTGVFSQVGSDQALHTTILSAGATNWTATLDPVTTNVTFVSGDVNTGTEVITATGHALADNDIIHFTTSAADLPLPLLEDHPYYVTGVSGNDLKVSHGRGGTNIVNLTDGGSGTHTINQDNIVLNVTGDTGDTVEWNAEVEVTIAR